MSFLTITTLFLRSDLEDEISRRTESEIELAVTKSENRKLKETAVIYNRSFKNFPKPVFGKVKRGDDFIINYANPKYEEVFGHIFNYDVFVLFGKNNFQLGYPYSVAKRYQDIDTRVALTGISFKGFEFYPDTLGVIKVLEIEKWRDIIDRDTVVYGEVNKW